MLAKQKNMTNTNRALTVDAVWQANSGHPAVAMNIAELQSASG
jgi:transketolase